jgi:SAM-dependent methyltransferase
VAEAEGALIAQRGRPLEYRQIWEGKPVLRRLYTEYYYRILGLCQPGRTLEIGGGCGNLKSFAPEILSTDIVFAPWLDAVADATLLPFAAETFDNICLFDVLHHMERPADFLADAQRVLRPAGRIVMIEPAITPVSYLFYRLFHPEPVDMTVDPLAPSQQRTERTPWDANQAIPTLLLFQCRAILHTRFPRLRVRLVQRIAPFSYPLSGGFRSWSLLPLGLVRPLVSIEAILEPLLARFMAFRLIAVIEKLS